MVFIFWISILGIFWAMIGYPAFLQILAKLVRKKNKKDYSFEPTVTLMVVAHNEEKVMPDKLKNIVCLDYPKDKIKYLIASDNSTDKTNDIVEAFIKKNRQYNIRIHKTKEHLGKTNAQNEAQKLVDTEILVMTDANAMLEKNAIKEIVSSFSSPDIVYVSGKLVYGNVYATESSSNEGAYWNIDLMMREVESNIQTITAGNGALYACRNSEYHDFEPIECHDAAMPLYYGLQGKRAVFNKDAIAVEKAGETNEDEFKRKVRMSRTILHAMMPTVKVFNVFKYKWFSVFYFGHRTCRYSLWLFHIIALVANIFVAFLDDKLTYKITLGGQVLFWMAALTRNKKNKKYRVVSMCRYYGITVFAQAVGAWRIIMGKSKPTWEKAESTR